MEHAALSQKNKMLIVFRPPLNEAFPKYLQYLLVDPTLKKKLKTFDNIHYLKNRVIKYVDSMINDYQIKAQIADPRIKFDGSLHKSMAYFFFSAGEYECATTVGKRYEDALEACTKFEPIMRYKKLTGLADNELLTYKILQLNNEGRLWSVSNNATIENWLRFC